MQLNEPWPADLNLKKVGIIYPVATSPSRPLLNSKRVQVRTHLHLRNPQTVLLPGRIWQLANLRHARSRHPMRTEQRQRLASPPQPDRPSCPRSIPLHTMQPTNQEEYTLSQLAFVTTWGQPRRRKLHIDCTFFSPMVVS